MTIDEKLQHFYDTTVEECQEEAELSVAEHKKHLAEELESYKQFHKHTSDDAVKAESESVSREISKVLSAEQLSMKRNWNLRQNEYREKLFAEVKVLLEDFRATRKYEEYLCKKIREAKSFAESDEIFIYLSEEDQTLMDALSAKTGVSLEIAPKSFLGGIRARIPSKNILIDNSFLSSMETLKKEFKFDGGRKRHE